MPGKDDKIHSQGKKPDNVPKAEPRSFLPCSNNVIRGSALGFNAAEPPLEILLETLAHMIVDMYFDERTTGDNK